MLERLGLWPLRIVWFGLPIGFGLGLQPAVDRFEEPGPLIAELFLWAAWLVGFVATLAPSAVSLTTVRILAPSAVGVVAVSGFASSEWSGRLAIAAAYAALVTLIAYLAVVGDRMVNGSAYGSERRMTLRPPAFALLGPIQLAWVVTFAGLVTGPYLLAAGRYAFGVAALVAGVGAIWLGSRVLHQLARRWLVFVPAGFVIHDHVVPVESILLRRTIVSSLGPARTPLAEGAIDLTGGAAGLALEAVLDEEVTFGRRVGRDVVTTDADRLVFTPTLPGAVLTEARLRAIKIGTPPSSADR